MRLICDRNKKPFFFGENLDILTFFQILYILLPFFFFFKYEMATTEKIGTLKRFGEISLDRGLKIGTVLGKIGTLSSTLDKKKT